MKKTKRKGSEDAKPRSERAADAEAHVRMAADWNSHFTERLRQLCLAYPEATEVEQFGRPWWKAGDKPSRLGHLVAHLPTPFKEGQRFAARLTGHGFLIKRDDCTGMVMGSAISKVKAFFAAHSLQSPLARETTARAVLSAKF